MITLHNPFTLTLLAPLEVHLVVGRGRFTLGGHIPPHLFRIHLLGPFAFTLPLLLNRNPKTLPIPPRPQPPSFAPTPLTLHLGVHPQSCPRCSPPHLRLLSRHSRPLCPRIPHMQNRAQQVMAFRCLRLPGFPSALPHARRQGMPQRKAVWKVGKGRHLQRLWRATGHCGAKCGFLWT
ncbi:hypothetical protein VTI74DRAFT_7319 [Chaetomium olivicolor]